MEVNLNVFSVLVLHRIRREVDDTHCHSRPVWYAARADATPVEADEARRLQQHRWQQHDIQLRHWSGRQFVGACCFKR
jgi:hypothetical protein